MCAIKYTALPESSWEPIHDNTADRLVGMDLLASYSLHHFWYWIVHSFALLDTCLVRDIHPHHCRRDRPYGGITLCWLVVAGPRIEFQWRGG